MLFKRFYPYLHTTHQGILLLYSAAYIFYDSPFYRPWLHLLNIDIRRLSPDELSRGPTAPAGILPKIQHYGLESMQYIIPGSIFFFKFIEWWNTSSLRSSATSLDLAAPPPLKPPSLPLLTEKDVAKGQCPICREGIVNPTAFTVSGAVACYTCAFKHVQQEASCPLTGLTASKHDLRKIVG